MDYNLVAIILASLAGALLGYGIGHVISNFLLPPLLSKRDIARREKRNRKRIKTAEPVKV